MIPESGHKRRYPEPSIEPSASVPPKASRPSSIFDNPREIGDTPLLEVVKRALETVRTDPYGYEPRQQQQEKIREAAHVWSKMAEDSTIQLKAKQKIKKLCRDLNAYTISKYQPSEALTIQLKGGSLKLNDFYLQLLKSESPFIDAMLESGMKETTQRAIDFLQQPFDKEIFRLILNVLEDESFPIPPDQAYTFINACDILQLEGLKKRGIQSLVAAMSAHQFDFESLNHLDQILKRSFDNSIEHQMLAPEIRFQFINLLLNESFEILEDSKIKLGDQEISVPLNREELEFIKASKEQKNPISQRVAPDIRFYMQLHQLAHIKVLPVLIKHIEDPFKAYTSTTNYDKIPLPLVRYLIRLVTSAECSKEFSLSSKPLKARESSKLFYYLHIVSEEIYQSDPSEENLRNRAAILINFAAPFPSKLTPLFDHLNQLIVRKPNDVSLRELRIGLMDLIRGYSHLYKVERLEKCLIQVLGDFDQLIANRDDYLDHLKKGLLTSTLFLYLSTNQIKDDDSFPDCPETSKIFMNAINKAPPEIRPQVIKIVKQSMNVLIKTEEEKDPINNFNEVYETDELLDLCGVTSFVDDE
jgi:hypothetical protein